MAQITASKDAVGKRVRLVSGKREGQYGEVVHYDEENKTVQIAFEDDGEEVWKEAKRCELVDADGEDDTPDTPSISTTSVGKTNTTVAQVGSFKVTVIVEISQ